MEYTPFYERYKYGELGSVVPKNPIHARQLSAHIKRSLRRIRADLSKKLLMDPLTQAPVLSKEYLEWRGRAVRAMRQHEAHLESVLHYNRHFRYKQRRYGRV